MKGFDKFSIGIVIGMVLLIVFIIVAALLHPEPKDDRMEEEPSIFDGERIPTTEVIVAIQPIAQGSEFVQSSVGRRPWPANNVPPDVIADEAELFGKVANREIIQGQPIIRDMLADKPDLMNAPQLYASCDVEDSTMLVYSFSAEAGAKEPNIVLGSSGVVRLQAVDEGNQAKISCNRDGFGQVTVNFVDPNTTTKDMILYSCTLPLECQDGAVTVTTYSPPETE